MVVKNFTVDMLDKWNSFVNAGWAWGAPIAESFEFDMSLDEIANASYEELKDRILLVEGWGEVVGYFMIGKAHGDVAYALGRCYDCGEEMCMRALREANPEAVIANLPVVYYA